MVADTEVTSIVVAGIGTAGVVLAALIPTLAIRRAQAESRGNQENLLNRVGVPNGKGDLATMNERQIVQNEIISAQVAHVAKKQDDHSELDNRRFRVLHDHLGIPFDEGETK